MQSIDAPPLPPGCDYAELVDNANDNVTPNSTGISEDTMTGGIGKVFCGNVDFSHYDSANQTVDVDSFQFTLAADSEIRVDLTGAGLDALDDAEILLTDGTGANINFDGDGFFFVNHAVTIGGLPAGTYSVAMFAGSAMAPSGTTPIPYKIKVTAFSLATACPAATGTATHAEGAGDNDVLTFKYGAAGVGFRHLTTKATDAVEATGITLAGGTNASISGTQAAGAAIDADDYLDRDTFEVATGTTTNEMVVRLDWANTQADLDMFLLPKITPPLTGNWFDIAAANIDSGVGPTGKGGPEVLITAVDPSMGPYWIMAGGYKGSLLLPSPYTINVCPANFTP